MLSTEKKIATIAANFKEIMEVLGLDLADESLKHTPRRVAQMYVTEAFKGLDPSNFPEISLFENKYNYQEMLIAKNITLYSYCEHHFVPFIGKVHTAYISTGKIIGLSKLNRIVEFYSKRPQLQEKLTEQIATFLKNILNTKDVAVVIEAEHLCVSSRGIKDTCSSTTTQSMSGKFKDPEIQNQFFFSLQTSAN